MSSVCEQGQEDFATAAKSEVEHSLAPGEDGVRSRSLMSHRVERHKADWVQ